MWIWNQFQCSSRLQLQIFQSLVFFKRFPSKVKIPWTQLCSCNLFCSSWRFSATAPISLFLKERKRSMNLDDRWLFANASSLALSHEHWALHFFFAAKNRGTNFKARAQHAYYAKMTSHRYPISIKKRRRIDTFSSFYYSRLKVTGNWKFNQK